MINAVLVFNNAGQPRLTKFYTQLETAVQQRLISEIFTLVANRPNSACNFLPYAHVYNAAWGHVLTNETACLLSSPAHPSPPRQQPRTMTRLPS
jgi:hypothetical protein